jgi:hypothetical protein
MGADFILAILHRGTHARLVIPLKKECVKRIPDESIYFFILNGAAIAGARALNRTCCTFPLF